MSVPRPGSPRAGSGGLYAPRPAILVDELTPAAYTVAAPDGTPVEVPSWVISALYVALDGPTAPGDRTAPRGRPLPPPSRLRFRRRRAERVDEDAT